MCAPERHAADPRPPPGGPLASEVDGFENAVTVLRFFMKVVRAVLEWKGWPWLAAICAVVAAVLMWWRPI